MVTRQGALCPVFYLVSLNLRPRVSIIALEVFCECLIRVIRVSSPLLPLAQCRQEDLVLWLLCDRAAESKSDRDWIGVSELPVFGRLAIGIFEK